ncbi:MAG TPA: hypothetical protein VLZ78_10445 [Terrimesophilobacter sp.]|nr:hypothetical protein [Terrimesophilobacter sp.]
MKKRSALLIAVLTAVITLVLPFIGGSGPSLIGETAAAASQTGVPVFASVMRPAAPAVVVPAASSASPIAYSVAARSLQRTATTSAASTVDTEHLAQKPVPKPVVVEAEAAPSHAQSAGTARARTAAPRAAGTAKAGTPAGAPAASGGGCPGPVGGGTGGAPGASYDGGAITGTTSSDLASFASTYNSIRVANCLPPVPMSHFRFDGCMETRLVWMAEDPSTDPMSAWGHMGSQRSDGVPSRGCDGNLAGGSGNTGATVAQKWWNSLSHRLSLYKPSNTGSTEGVCIYFAMTHGGVPNESHAFTRAAARWGGC